MEKAALLAEQYADAANLSTRAEFNDRYTRRDVHPHEWVFDHLSAPRDASVLDVGCGPGSFWTANADRIPEGWTGVLGDFSRNMVEEAESHLAGAAFDSNPTVVDAEGLPFAAGTFDAALALQMLYHVPDRSTALAEFHRALDAEGALYATTTSEANSRTLLETMSAAADGTVTSLASDFTAENGREQLEAHFDAVERHVFENEIRVDDPDAVTAYALSLPLDAPQLSAFDPDDADAFRSLVAERIRNRGAMRWTKNMALFVARP